MQRLLAAADELLDKTVLFSYTNIGYRLRQRRRRRRSAERDVRGLTCIVTGANSGLGKQVALALAERGASVQLLCRNPDRGAAAQRDIRQRSGNPDVQLHIVDLSVQADIRRFAREFEPEQVAVLVNNAGVLLNERRVSAENIEMTFATNVVGPFLLTELLLPRLKRAEAARVINVTSGGMYLARLHPDDLQFEQRVYYGTRAYAESKRAEVVMARLWADAWRDSDIAVHAVHPGWAGTPGVAHSLPRFNQVMRPLLRTPAQGADGIIWLCLTPELDHAENGQLWFDRQARPQHKLGIKRNDSAEIAQFWRALHDLVG